MIVTGGIVMFGWPISRLIGDDWVTLNSECGINSNWDYYYHSIDLHSISSLNGLIIYFTFSILCLIWDITTFLLYVYKIRFFRRYKESQRSVYQRILRILYKISTLTMFYQIVGFYSALLMFILGIYSKSVWNNLVIGILVNINPVTMSFCMYLMMEYNKDLYNKFLKIIHLTKLDTVYCCCCKYVVMDQLNEMDEDIQTAVTVVDMKRDNVNKTIDTEYETRNMSLNDQKIATNGCELSVQTITVTQ